MRNCKYLFCCLIMLMSANAGIAQTNRTKKTETKAEAPKPKAVTAEVNKNVSAPAPVAENSNLRLGRYELYSGIPAMYLGHFILLANGKYKVAFSTDEDNYDERGSYTFHNDTNTIEWQTGMFMNNNWGGKLVKTEKGFRIQLNKATYGDSK